MGGAWRANVHHVDVIALNDLGVVSRDNRNIEIGRDLVRESPIRIGDRHDFAPAVPAIPGEVCVTGPRSCAEYRDSNEARGHAM
jgi:hypothetical protein